MLCHVHIQNQHMRRYISDYLSQIFAIKMPQKQAMQEIFTEINRSLTKAYQEPEMKKFISSLTVESLLSKSIQFFVGSRTTPRNEFIMKLLMQQAKARAEKQADPRLIKSVEYHYAYYVKMGALKDGNNEEYERSSNMFMDLAEKGDHLSSYLVGKQFYKLTQTGEMGNWEDQSHVNQMKKVFSNSICNHQFGGLYFIADVDERHNTSKQNPSEQSERMRFELYLQAASIGYPLAYFKIALIYKKRGNQKMYKNYLLKASEAGIIEAQHNLALEYVKGEFFPKDQIKALAWFLHASAYGFVYSKYNLSKMLAKGTSCGRLKPNPKASLIYLQEINRSGQLDVTKQIQETVATLHK